MPCSYYPGKKPSWTATRSRAASPWSNAFFGSTCLQPMKDSIKIPRGGTKRILLPIEWNRTTIMNTNSIDCSRKVLSNYCTASGIKGREISCRVKSSRKVATLDELRIRQAISSSSASISNEVQQRQARRSSSKSNQRRTWHGSMSRTLTATYDLLRRKRLGMGCTHV